jgi:hypothetical protein
LLRLAARLGLPATQYQLAVRPPVGIEAPLSARYPAPDWTPARGWRRSRRMCSWGSTARPTSWSCARPPAAPSTSPLPSTAPTGLGLPPLAIRRGVRPTAEIQGDFFRNTRRAPVILARFGYRAVGRRLNF